MSTPKKTKRVTKKKSPSRIQVKEGELILVTWMDACATVGWEDHRAANLKTAHCKSIGWLGKSSDPERTMVLYADRAFDDKEDHDSNRRIAIPTGWITGIKRIRE